SLQDQPLSHDGTPSREVLSLFHETNHDNTQPRTAVLEITTARATTQPPPCWLASRPCFQPGMNSSAGINPPQFPTHGTCDCPRLQVVQTSPWVPFARGPYWNVLPPQLEQFGQ